MHAVVTRCGLQGVRTCERRLLLPRLESSHLDKASRSSHSAVTGLKAPRSTDEMHHWHSRCCLRPTSALNASSSNVGAVPPDENMVPRSTNT